MFSLFRRAWQYAPLSPAERAFLKTFWVIVRGAFVSAVMVAFTYATTHTLVNALTLLGVAFAYFIEAASVGIGKWIGASADPQLGTDIVQAGSDISSKILASVGVSNTKTASAPVVAANMAPVVPPAPAAGAAGGVVATPSMVIVGERGPEAVRLPTGAMQGPPPASISPLDVADTAAS